MEKSTVVQAAAANNDTLPANIDVNNGPGTPVLVPTPKKGGGGAGGGAGRGRGKGRAAGGEKEIGLTVE